MLDRNMYFDVNVCVTERANGWKKKETKNVERRNIEEKYRIEKCRKECIERGKM
jgi:hypothetical protein